MHNHPSAASAFSVFRFTLQISPEGRPRQQTTPCGAFASAESALARARELAEAEVRRLQELPAGEADRKPVILLDTEWGYDIRYDWLTVSRFWVHDAAAHEPLPAEL